jgi:hypothetical protein
MASQSENQRRMWEIVVLQLVWRQTGRRGLFHYYVDGQENLVRPHAHVAHIGSSVLHVDVYVSLDSDSDSDSETDLLWGSRWQRAE